MMNTHEFTNDDERFDRLTDYVEETYSNIDADECAKKFEASSTDMVEIEATGDGEFDFILIDLPDQPRFSYVHVPDKLKSLLASEDVFLGTFGLRDGEWHIIWLSPPYESFDWAQSEEYEH